MQPSPSLFPTLLLLGIFYCAAANLSAAPLDYEREIFNLDVENNSFPVQFYFDKTGAPQGGLIITYHGAGSHLVSNLGYVLSQFGWSVALLRLDDQAYIAKRMFHKPQSKSASKTKGGNAVAGEDAVAGEGTVADDAVADADETDDNAEALNDAEALDGAEAPNNAEAAGTAEPERAPISAAAKLKRIITFMEEEQGQFNLVFMSIDQSWPKVYEFVLAETEKLANMQGLILMNVQQQVSLKDLPETLPILDINSKQALGEVYASRKFTARRFKLTRYQQLHLPTRHWQHDFKEDRLVKRIRGWLSINIKGMEVDKR